MRGMDFALIRSVLSVSAAAVIAGAALQAQAPQTPPGGGVQVAVPQGNAQDQAAAAARQQQQQAARAKLANQPAPRTADGRIVLGNTATIKGVWVGGGLGFCNANTVAAPASLNPGATQGPGGVRGAGPGGAAAPAGGGAPAGGAGSRSNRL